MEGAAVNAGGPAQAAVKITASIIVLCMGWVSIPPIEQYVLVPELNGRFG